jgi:hypothetical protein
LTVTTNFGWTKPTVGADSNTWGGELNSNLDSLDTLLGGIVSTGGAIQHSTGSVVAPNATESDIVALGNGIWLIRLTAGLGSISAALVAVQDTQGIILAQARYSDGCTFDFSANTLRCMQTSMSSQTFTWYAAKIT